MAHTHESATSKMSKMTFLVVTHLPERSADAFAVDSSRQSERVYVNRSGRDCRGGLAREKMSQNPSGGKRQSVRQLRERKQKKLYSEDWALGDEEIEGRRSFNLQEKLENPSFVSHNVVREMHGNELNVAYFQKYGFSTPLLFREKVGLGLRVPTSNFTVADVRMCVGSRRILDVMDVNTQKNSEMTMKEWQRYYEEPRKDRLLNVISLEFSHTKLENYVQSPTVVRQVDWVDCVWPRHLKDSQTEATNLLEDMKYPKVQKYCLMSVKGCYTDFHVDFGGTSVWYHILKGGKVFWLIPPTEHNLALYERWVLSGKQSDIFFGDTVDKCTRIILTEGNTFFIPTGWIHAVYTPVDSLVFGGNFLHSYGIDKQLKIAQVEDTTKVPQKFRYPFFTEMLWYVLERYVHCLLGHSHLATGQNVTVPPDRPHVHLTQAELHGLKEIVMYLHMLPANKKNLPDLIRDPVALIQDVRTLIGLHRQDNRDYAISGRPVLFLQQEGGRHKSNNNNNNGVGRGHGKHHHHHHHHHGNKQQAQPGQQGHQPVDNKDNGKLGPVDKSGGPRRRRTRCKKCEACQRSDCGECSFCLDMVKFGGPGRAKQTCNMRQCLQPMLPVTAACAHCGLDGWNQTPVTPLQKGPQRCESASNLMECSVCYEIAHPACVHRQCLDFTGYVNEDMPNSWECPMCCKLGKNTDYRPRHFRARQKSSDMRRMSISSSDAGAIFDTSTTTAITPPTTSAPHVATSSHHSVNIDKPGSHHGNSDKPATSNQDAYSDTASETEAAPPMVKGKELLPIKKRRSSDGEAEVTKVDREAPVVRKTAFRMQLAHQIAGSSSKVLKKPMVVVRPAPLPPSAVTSNLAMDKRCLLKVFRYLTPSELVTCALVCKTWGTFTVDPSLWTLMEFTRKHISSAILKGIVRRQPQRLRLDWCHINKFQLPWLIQRLSCLHELSLVSVNVRTAISLRSIHSIALLRSLDLSFVSDFNDSALRDILGPNNDSRRGLADENKVRFRGLRTLKLAGTDVTDIAMRYVTQYLPNLQHLSLSLCARISDAGIAQLTTSPASSVTRLVSLDLSHSKLVTESSLEQLGKCEALVRLDCRHSLLISTQALIKFAAKSDRDLQVRDIKLVDKRQPK